MFVGNDRPRIWIIPTIYPPVDELDLIRRWSPHDLPDYMSATAAGVSEGIAAIPGLPAELWKLVLLARDYGQAKRQRREFDDVYSENRRSAWIPYDTLDKWSGPAWNEAYGYQYQPTTRVGDFLKNGASFATSALGGGVGRIGLRMAMLEAEKLAARKTLREMGKHERQILGQLHREEAKDGLRDLPKDALYYGAGPGIASEAAGQIAQGTTYERYARIGTAATAGKFAYGLRNPRESWLASGWLQPFSGAGMANNKWNMRLREPASFDERFGAANAASAPWIETANEPSPSTSPVLQSGQLPSFPLPGREHALPTARDQVDMLFSPTPLANQHVAPLALMPPPMNDAPLTREWTPQPSLMPQPVYGGFLPWFLSGGQTAPLGFAPPPMSARIE